MTQGKVAVLLDLSQASYSKLEAGETDPTLSTVAKVAEITSLPVAALLGVQTFPEPSLGEMMRSLVDAGYRVEKAAPAAPEPAGRRAPHPDPLSKDPPRGEGYKS